MTLYPKSNRIHTIWYYVSAFVRILEIECALQLTGMEKTTSVIYIGTNSVISVTVLTGGLYFMVGSTHPQFLFLLCRKESDFYACN